MSKEEMAARPEAQLEYPGSMLVWERGWDEGEGLNDFDKSAAITRWRKVDAAPEAIQAWYREQLEARGWTRGVSSEDGIMDTYRRGPEDDPQQTFFVIIRRPGFGMWEPPGGFDSTATTYEIDYRQRPDQPSGLLDRRG